MENSICFAFLRYWVDKPIYNTLEKEIETVKWIGFLIQTKSTFYRSFLNLILQKAKVHKLVLEEHTCFTFLFSSSASFYREVYLNQDFIFLSYRKCF